jgi:hypothetical protein
MADGTPVMVGYEQGPTGLRVSHIQDPDFNLRLQELGYQMRVTAKQIQVPDRPGPRIAAT